MKVRSPAIIAIIAAGSVFAQASGVLSTVGSALIGVDSAIRAAIDLKALAKTFMPPKRPKFVPIKQIILPTKAQVRK